MMKLAICDDNVEQMHKIQSMCQAYSDKKGISFYYIEFSSGEQVINYKDDIDILLLDIELPGISGLRVMEMAEDRIIKEINKKKNTIRGIGICQKSKKSNYVCGNNNIIITSMFITRRRQFRKNCR